MSRPFITSATPLLVRVLCILVLLEPMLAGRAGAAPGTPTPPPPPVDVKGIVQDALNRPLVDAQVELIDASGKVMTTVKTDRRGHFTLTRPADGAFSVRISRPGFKPTIEAVPLRLEPLNVTLTAEDAVEMTITVQRERPSGPGISKNGANDYSITDREIDRRPAGQNTTLPQLLTTMPGVALDQNAEIHFRGQHNVGQYVVNGVILPLDMYADPSFISFLNPLCFKRLDLLTGVLPAQYGFSNIGGIIDITTKDGSEMKSGNVSLYGGMRGVVQPSAQYGNASGKFSYYINGLYNMGNTAFSSATPGPEPFHNYTWQFQSFGNFVYKFDEHLKLTLMTAYTNSVNQLPNVPGLIPQFVLAGYSPVSSANIDSYLNFRDALGVLALNGTDGKDFKWQIAACVHNLTQRYYPDKGAELAYQGVSATTRATNEDQTLQGDVEFKLDRHTLSAGFYYGRYNIGTDDASLVFPADADGNQVSSTPLSLINNFRTADTLSAIYVNDLWRISPKLKANIGVRVDRISGFSNDTQIDPTINLMYTPAPGTTIHLGWAHYMDTPRFQAFSPQAQASFIGTTNAQPPGQVSPFAQHDQIWDLGFVKEFDRHFSLSFDSYYEINKFYSDEGQFGVVPIFVGFNYGHGSAWGTELGLKYRNRALDAYFNVTYGRSYQYGIASGQYNFPPDELAAINRFGIPLDHEPLVNVSAGASYKTGPWTFSLSGLYNSGLRTGFDFQKGLPSVSQIDIGIQRDFVVPKIGTITNRLTVVNAFDRTNLLRPGGGIGVFQTAYGPRFGVFDSLSVPLH